MIASELSPSRLWGAVATSIHTRSFNCFVSTARQLFLWNTWSTQLYIGDPGVDTESKFYCRVVYSKWLNRERIYAGHSELSHILDVMGEDGYSLPEAAESIFEIWLRYGAIKPVFVESWMHLAVANEASPLPNWLR